MVLHFFLCGCVSSVHYQLCWKWSQFCLSRLNHNAEQSHVLCHICSHTLASDYYKLVFSALCILYPKYKNTVVCFPCPFLASYCPFHSTKWTCQTLRKLPVFLRLLFFRRRAKMLSRKKEGRRKKGLFLLFYYELCQNMSDAHNVELISYWTHSLHIKSHCFLAITSPNIMQTTLHFLPQKKKGKTSFQLDVNWEFMATCVLESCWSNCRLGSNYHSHSLVPLLVCWCTSLKLFCMML